jgi:ATP-dependent DNA helicase RecQ
MLKVLDVDGAVTRVAGGWAATGRPWDYDGERYERVARERTREQQSMLAYQATTECRMEFLRRELDDPAAAPCRRCDNCTGQHWPADVPAAGTEAAREQLARPGTTVEPRKMWPTGMKELGIDASGKIAATALAEPGRALGRLTDIGWGAALRTLLSEQAPDGPITDQLADAMVKVLASWDWKQRPAAVVTMPSRTRPELITTLGQRIATIGRLPYLGALGYATDDGPGPRRHNSAQRLAALWRALTVPADLRDALKSNDSGPVLLIDDQIDTGWTMTVAAMLLRDAGAPAVLPLALAVTTG